MIAQMIVVKNPLIHPVVVDSTLQKSHFCNHRQTNLDALEGVAVGPFVRYPLIEIITKGHSSMFQSWIGPSLLTKCARLRRHYSQRTLLEFQLRSRFLIAQEHG